MINLITIIIISNGLSFKMSMCRVPVPTGSALSRRRHLSGNLPWPRMPTGSALYSRAPALCSRRHLSGNLPWPRIVTGLIIDILGNSTVGETYYRRIWENDKFSIISQKISNFKIFSRELKLKHVKFPFQSQKKIGEL